MLTRFFTVVLVVVFGLAGCDNALEKTDMLNSNTDFHSLKKADLHTIYIKPVFYKAGLNEWTTYLGGGTPELKPSEEQVKFKERYMKEVGALLKKNGYLFDEVEKDPGGVIFAEMRIDSIESPSSFAAIFFPIARYISR